MALLDPDAEKGLDNSSQPTHLRSEISRNESDFDTHVKTCAGLAQQVADDTQRLLAELERLRPDVKPAPHFNIFLQVWRNPLIRLSTVGSVAILDWYNYVEDPIDMSKALCLWAPVGQLLEMVSLWKVPSLENKPFLWVVKPFLILGSILLGIKLGGYIWRRLSRWKPKLFCPKKQRGVWLVPFLTFVITLFLSSRAWNLALGCCGHGSPLDSTSEEEVECEDRCATSNTHITNQDIGMVCQTCSWFADVISILVILDIVLQEPQMEQYLCIGERCAGALSKMSERWTKGKFRIYFLYFVFVASTAQAITLILRFGTRDDNIASHSEDEITIAGVQSHRSEVGRAFVSACVFCLDLCTIAQDPDFPTFANPMGIKMLGTDLVMDGKWANYGVLMIVMFLDTMNLLNLVVWYRPLIYGQYKGKDQRLWRITNSSLLGEITHSYALGEITHNQNLKASVDYTLRISEMGCWRTCPETRSGDFWTSKAQCCGDQILNSRYIGGSQTWKVGIGAMISTTMLLLILFHKKMQRTPKEQIRRCIVTDLKWTRRLQRNVTHYLHQMRLQRVQRVAEPAPPVSKHWLLAREKAVAAKKTPPVTQSCEMQCLSGIDDCSTSASLPAETETGTSISVGCVPSPSPLASSRASSAEKIISNVRVEQRSLLEGQQLTGDEDTEYARYLWVVTGKSIYALSNVPGHWQYEDLVYVIERSCDSSVPRDIMKLVTLEGLVLGPEVRVPRPGDFPRPIVFVQGHKGMSSIKTPQTS